MGYARKNLISLNDTPYYHCIARCVRRAWLWGFDEYAGKDYSHRKHWLIDRLECQVSIRSIVRAAGVQQVVLDCSVRVSRPLPESLSDYLLHCCWGFI